MKPRFIIASTALAMAVFAGSAQADLVGDLTTMPASQALSKAMQSGNQSIEAVISAAAAKLKGQPELLSSLISAAVKAFPEQAAQIVSVAIAQAPTQSATIVDAALAATEGNASMQAAINQAAEEQIAKIETETETETVEAEQTEVEGQIPPPPPAANSGSSDKPTSVSPTS